MLANQIRKYAVGFILIISVLTSSFFLFFRKTQVNPVTGKEQHITLTPKQEIALGLESAPDMAARFGGLYPDMETQNRVKGIGRKLVAVRQVRKSPYQFDFHVLTDSQAINIISFPGGQILITRGLLKLLKTDNEIAAVLSHEIGHIMGRHTTEEMSGFDILETFKDSADFANEYSPDKISNYITDLLKIKFNWQEESEANELALKYLISAGYKTNMFAEILKKLDSKSKETDLGDFTKRHPHFGK